MEQNTTSTMKRERRKFSPEFKEQALERVKQFGLAQTARDLDLSESLLYNWRSKRESTGQTFQEQKDLQSENQKLQRRLKRLEQENEFLKKAAAYFAREQEQDTQ